MSSLICPHCDARIAGADSLDICPVCFKSINPDRPMAWHPDAETIGLPSEFRSPREWIDTNSAAGSSNPTVSRRFADYELESVIARGGMGVIYRARQVSLNRPVAVKMILAGQLASAQDRERFQLEAEAAAHLDHPHIVPIYDVGQHEGNHFFTMKLVEGSNLAIEMPALVKRPRDGVRLLIKVCRAIHYAHQRGILHRDIKPANILLDATSEPLVSDFGLAKRVDGSAAHTYDDRVLGTPSYMAPEQATTGKRAVTTSADVYSLGAILYEMLTGQPPFSADSPIDTLLLVVEQEPKRPRLLTTKVDADLETIAMKCLDKDPSRRYGSSEALADELDRWLAGVPILARPIGGLERTVKWARRRPATAALTSAVITVAVLGFGGVMWEWRQAESQRLQAEAARRDASDKALAEMKARAAAESATKAELESRSLAESQKLLADAYGQAVDLLLQLDVKQAGDLDVAQRISQLRNAITKLASRAVADGRALEAAADLIGANRRYAQANDWVGVLRRYPRALQVDAPLVNEIVASSARVRARMQEGHTTFENAKRIEASRGVDAARPEYEKAGALLSYLPDDALEKVEAAKWLRDHAASIATAPSAQESRDDVATIQKVVEAYARAYSELDPSAVLKVFPTADLASLSTGFQSLKSQEITIAIERITVNGFNAQVVCTWTARVKSRLGLAVSHSGPATLQLQKSPTGWIIVRRS